MRPETEKALGIARLVMRFGQVKRATLENDGRTPESDAMHTVMVGILACAVASKLRPDLDVGRIAQFSLVHDLVEAYSGDVSTYGHKSEEFFQQKEANERAALSRIREEFDSVYPWIGQTIEAYESLTAPEARFVKALDKCMPKLTHLLNGAVELRRKGETPETLAAFLTKQREKMLATYAADQAEVMQLHTDLSSVLIEEMRRPYAPETLDL